MSGKIKDVDKLIIIAQTYSFLKGEFSVNELYNFIHKNNYKFHSDFTTKRIGSNISRSSKFKKTKEGFIPKYKAIT